MYPIY